MKNGAESDTDCGGSCAKKCVAGQPCDAGADCETGHCNSGVCQPPCLDVTFAFVGSGQMTTIPAAGTFTIEAAGAQGGPDAFGHAGGLGARMRGDFALAKGDLLQLIVGGRPSPGGPQGSDDGGGGGGGTFVYLGASAFPLPAQPLIVAGGGGGGEGGGGVIGLDGFPGAGPGGVGGQGGGASTQDFIYSGGGGAGWLSVGVTGSTPTLAGAGQQWLGGWGTSYGGSTSSAGGFGGGGGAGQFNHAGGGGGGYSGGGGGAQTVASAGGGGSFNAGASPVNTPSVNANHGWVRLVGPAGACP